MTFLIAGTVNATVDALVATPDNSRLASAFQCNAPVAQLDRVPGYELGGREFESLRARHFNASDIKSLALLFLLPVFVRVPHDPSVGNARVVDVTSPLSQSMESRNLDRRPRDCLGGVCILQKFCLKRMPIVRGLMKPVYTCPSGYVVETPCAAQVSGLHSEYLYSSPRLSKALLTNTSSDQLFFCMPAERSTEL